MGEGRPTGADPAGLGLAATDGLASAGALGEAAAAGRVDVGTLAGAPDEQALTSATSENARPTVIMRNLRIALMIVTVATRKNLLVESSAGEIAESKLHQTLIDSSRHGARRPAARPLARIAQIGRFKIGGELLDVLDHGFAAAGRTADPLA